MRLFLIFLCGLLGSTALLAQEEYSWPEASKESLAYHEYRMKTSTPPYGLEKVKILIRTIKTTGDDDLKLSQKDYLPLSLREKFTYHMIHAESYSQNCDAMPPIPEEDKKIFAYLPDAFDEYSWSERQRNFLRSNRDSIMALIQESVERSKRMGLNYKSALIEINAHEMIPFLIRNYLNGKKDHDILTVLILLMKNNEYPPFMTSVSFKKLYGNDANYQAYIDLNTPNEDLIIKRATDFHKMKHK